VGAGHINSTTSQLELPTAGSSSPSKVARTISSFLVKPDGGDSWVGTGDIPWHGVYSWKDLVYH
jgi:hypothetical protein